MKLDCERSVVRAALCVGSPNRSSLEPVRWSSDITCRAEPMWTTTARLPIADSDVTALTQGGGHREAGQTELRDVKGTTPQCEHTGCYNAVLHLMRWHFSGHQQKKKRSNRV